MKADNLPTGELLLKHKGSYLAQKEHVQAEKNCPGVKSRIERFFHVIHEGKTFQSSGPTVDSSNFTAQKNGQMLFFV